MDYDRLSETLPDVAAELARRMQSDALPLLQERDVEIGDVDVAVSLTCSTKDGHRLKFTFSITDGDDDQDGD